LNSQQARSPTATMLRYAYVKLQTTRTNADDPGKLIRDLTPAPNSYTLLAGT